MADNEIRLSDVPEAGEDFEDYVGSLFQAAGYFVEKQIIQRDPRDVLELDLVVTRYAQGVRERTLVEVKGGGWGYSDCFKVIGWLQYLGFERGLFFAKHWGNQPDAGTRLAPHNLQIVVLDNFSSPEEPFAMAGLGVADKSVQHLWRYSNDVEHRLVKIIYREAKTDSAGASAAKRYYELINHGTFHSRNAAETIEQLYDAFKEHPRLTLSYALQLDGHPFDPQTPSGQDSLSLKKAMYEGAEFRLQATMYFEQRARLAILKAGIDYLLERSAQSRDPVPEGEIEWSELLAIGGLPQSFQSGLRWLRDQPTFHLYATFWQQFMWGWGGFYLADREQEEFIWMSKYSGIPVDEIPAALTAFDQLFPRSGGWFTNFSNTDVRMVKMNPRAFQGIGVHQRRQEYETELVKMKFSSQYTFNDLARFTQSAFALLSQ